MINFDNSAPVRLKGVGDGFWITLDPSQPENVLKSEIDKLFKNLRHLIINSSVIIDIKDARGHDDLIENIKSYLINTFEVARVSKPSEKRSIPTERIRQRDLSKGWNHHKSDVLMLRGRVRSGQKVESKKHIVIAGDVNPGSEIIAGGDVIVLGRLAGKVQAGCPNDETAIIFALDFNPNQIEIAGFFAPGINKKDSAKPEYACVEDRCIVVKDYMEANPFRKLPWPEAI
ncbi:septum site-determining protein MinC [Desulfobacula phenolica]|uniref:Probable septum site-determining protein MinC n=1 Tax=Desulfobacula phenolica TaxID=90732 RepID=A0A1H2ISQ1_9BACT|nr:septum site-determining protein MinC [Desulfobacula phenolica]SDU47169.1 septum site-determining protein MinC [Desulfobacula phenolica]